MTKGDRMNKLATALFVIALGVASGLLSSCKKAESVSEADVLGTWEITAWDWKQPQYFLNYDMLGTLVFSPVSYGDWRGVRVDLTFKRDGLVQTAHGDAADLTNLPIIKFDGFWDAGFYGGHLAFRGIVEDGGMIGSGGFFWDIPGGYGHWEWEAVKK